jgi:AcrR family transcriptional regulator
VVLSTEEVGMAPRDRYRAQVREEVKQAALRQLASGGPPAVSVNAIARELGVSGPALYRYFANRDDLLTELTLDAYDDLADALTGAGDLPATARAYRAWALAQPHRYRLLFAVAVPGFDAHTERLVAASQRSMDVLLAVVPPGPRPPPALAAQLTAWAARRGLDTTAPAALAAVRLWWRIHGLVSLEIDGNWASMDLDPALLLELEL